MSLNHKPLDSDLVFHKSLLEVERQWFWGLNHQELTKVEAHGLLVLVEGILAERVRGFKPIYTQPHETAQREGFALCAALLREDNGFSLDTKDKDDKVVKGEITIGREWLAFADPPRPLAQVLKFYFHLRKKRFDYHLSLARKRAGIIEQLDLTPSQP